MEIGETVGVEEERLYLTIPGFYITVVYAAGIDYGEWVDDLLRPVDQQVIELNIFLDTRVSESTDLFC